MSNTRTALVHGAQLQQQPFVPHESNNLAFGYCLNSSRTLDKCSSFRLRTSFKFPCTFEYVVDVHVYEAS